MISYAKFAVLVVVAIIAMALSAEARSLLDAWGNCYNSRSLPSVSLTCLHLKSYWHTLQ